ncbi:26S proteasome non-ATPase regulatory subunit 14-like protein [Tanacetum coccineum]
MLLNLHKKKWTDGLTLERFDTHSKTNDEILNLRADACYLILNKDVGIKNDGVYETYVTVVTLEVKESLVIGDEDINFVHILFPSRGYQIFGEILFPIFAGRPDLVGKEGGRVGRIPQVAMVLDDHDLVKLPVPDDSPVITKFGNSDDNDPTSGERYTQVYNKAWEDKQGGISLMVTTENADFYGQLNEFSKSFDHSTIRVLCYLAISEGVCGPSRSLNRSLFLFLGSLHGGVVYGVCNDKVSKEMEERIVISVDVQDGLEGTIATVTEFMVDG